MLTSLSPTLDAHLAAGLKVRDEDVTDDAEKKRKPKSHGKGNSLSDSLSTADRLVEYGKS